MIIDKLTEYCRENGLECDKCSHFRQCEDYSESIRNAPILNLDDEDGEEEC